MSYNLLWFKKDLRCQDHEALSRAMGAGPCIGVYILEPQYINSPEFSLFQMQFLYDSLQELQQELAKLSVPLWIFYGEAKEVFAGIFAQYSVKGVYSHMETGLWWTFQRDLQLKEFFASRSVAWFEAKQFAVLRGLRDRDRWNHYREQLIRSDKIFTTAPQKPLSVRGLGQGLSVFDSYQSAMAKLSGQRGGTRLGQQLLHSFLYERGRDYTRAMSSPVTAYEQCSRLSPYITFGCLSLRQITLALEQARRNLPRLVPSEQRQWARAYKSFESRLWWHCHFIQKLESEPEIEWENVNRAFDGMREADFCEQRFAAWCKGETGFPLVDACMRALHKYGWINFRMRAMLISFASYQLWLHWQRPAQYLASLFTDFEPGIHYSQAQMQSGVTGINSIRIYSPQKQTEDQDPDGVFIREHLPELAGLGTSDLLDPSQAPPMFLQMAGVSLGENYPYPIVDPKLAYQQAKEKIFAWRNRPITKELAKGVYQRHGSRKNSHFPAQNRQQAFGNWRGEKK